MDKMLNPVRSFSITLLSARCWGQNLRKLSHASRPVTRICTSSFMMKLEVSDVLDHVVALNDYAAVCASDVIVGISGHGFLIASDSLTRQPSGPGIQPER